ncbi:MAG: HDOD domain-containing protein, partial [bacterium]|nr:HDOD domain-containing protein [bacterium]
SQALVRIGLNNLRDIVLQASMNLRVFRSDAYADTMDRLRKHSAMTGHISKLLCKHVADVEGEYAFLCGLLHDVGIAATLIALSDAGPKKKAPDLVAIWPAIDRVHAQAGQLIAELWDLPEQIRQVIGCHHQVLVEGKPNRLAAVICIADQIARDRGHGLTPQDGENVAGVSELEAACLESHGAVDSSMPKTLEQAREALDLTEQTIRKVNAEIEAIEADLT